MKILKTFISVFCFILLTISIIFLSFSYNISNFAKKDNMKDYIKKIDLVKEIKKVKNSGSTNKQSKVTNMINDLYEMAEEFQFNEQAMDEIINSNVMKELLGSSAGSFSDYIINKNEAPQLTESNVYNLVDKNADKIFSVINVELSDSQREKFLNVIKLEIPDLVNTVSDASSFIDNKNSKEIELFREIFSKKTRVIVLISAVVCFVILVILNRKKSLLYLIASFFISGILIILSSFGITNIIIRIIKEAELSLFATPLANIFAQNIFITGSVMLLITTILYLIYKISCRKKS